MKMKLIIIIIIVSTASLLLASSSAAACSKSVFLLAGQSNMVGRGGTYTPSQKWDGVVPEQCASDPRILRLNIDSVWEQATEPLHSNISYGKCANSSQSFGVGPGMAFADALLEKDPAIGTIGLVPCAIGATGISQWGRGGCLYRRFLSRARASLRDGGVLRGMLWYQGENDAGNEVNARMYKGRLRKFFNDVRRDLMAPSLPIIQVALALPQDRLVKKVRRAQLNLKLPNVMCVDAAGLPLNGDDIHLTTEAQVQLGAMFANAFIKYFELLTN